LLKDEGRAVRPFPSCRIREAASAGRAEPEERSRKSLWAKKIYNGHDANGEGGRLKKAGRLNAGKDRPPKCAGAPGAEDDVKGRKDAAAGLRKGIVTIFLAAALCGLSAREATGGFVDLTPAEASRLMEANRGNPAFVVLDVRTDAEYREGHIPGAVLIDFRSTAFRERVASLARDRTCLVYCRTGNRSGSALGVMEELGLGTLHHLAGGIAAWKEKGLPVVE
jgi:rhodanese-related sulfurtransferase